ncbi:MAG: DUF3592 domain-containing protein [Phycisphaerales bacterium]|nr:DUF3592 domain-containing protein [Phycisphaerales bacterium]
MARKTAIGGWIALILFVLIPIGIPITIGARRAIIAWNIARNFEPTTAVITVSRTDVRISEAPDDSGGTQINSSYYPDIQFRYAIDGVEHETGTYAHPASVAVSIRGSRQRVDEIVAGYPTGTSHPAWYDPRDPAVAYLYLDSPWGGIWTIAKTLIIAAIIYAGLVVALILIQRQRSR